MHENYWVAWGICNAYEDGYENGLKQSNSLNPYDNDTVDYHAYKIGYERGTGRSIAAKEEKVVHTRTKTMKKVRHAFSEKVYYVNLSDWHSKTLGMVEIFNRNGRPYYHTTGAKSHFSINGSGSKAKLLRDDLQEAE